MKALIAGVLGGFLMFAWGAVSHMATPLGELGIQSAPAASLVAAGLKTAIPESGLYVFPAFDPAMMKDEAKMKEHEKQVAEGPSGIIIYTKSDGPTMGAKTLGLEFATDVVCGLLIVAVLKLGAFRSVGNRLIAGGLIGLYAAVAISASYCIWFNFPRDFTLASVAMESVGGLLAAIPAAFMLKPRG